MTRLDAISEHRISGMSTESTMSKKTFPVYSQPSEAPSNDPQRGKHQPGYDAHNGSREMFFYQRPFEHRHGRGIIAKSMLAYSEKMKEISQNRRLIPFIGSRPNYHETNQFNQTQQRPKRPIKPPTTYEWPNFKDTYRHGDVPRPSSNTRRGINQSRSLVFSNRPASDPLTYLESVNLPNGFRRYGLSNPLIRNSRLGGETNILTFPQDMRNSNEGSVNNTAYQTVSEPQILTNRIGVTGQTAVLHETHTDNFAAVMRHKDQFIGSKSRVDSLPAVIPPIKNQESQSSDPRPLSAEKDDESRRDSDLSSSVQLFDTETKNGVFEEKQTEEETLTVEAVSENRKDKRLEQECVNNSVGVRVLVENDPLDRITSPLETTGTSNLNSEEAKGDDTNTLDMESNEEKEAITETGKDLLTISMRQDKGADGDDETATVSLLSPSERSVQEAHLRVFGQSIKEADVKKRLDVPKHKTSRRVSLQEPESDGGEKTEEKHQHKQEQSDHLDENNEKVSSEEVQVKEGTENVKVKKKKSVQFGPEMIKEVTKIEYPWYNEDTSDEDDDDEDEDDEEEDDEEEEDDDGDEDGDDTQNTQTENDDASQPNTDY